MYIDYDSSNAGREPLDATYTNEIPYRRKGGLQSFHLIGLRLVPILQTKPSPHSTPKVSILRQHPTPPRPFLDMWTLTIPSVSPVK